jgi:hypothetical protein
VIPRAGYRTVPYGVLCTKEDGWIHGVRVNEMEWIEMEGRSGLFCDVLRCGAIRWDANRLPCIFLPSPFSANIPTPSATPSPPPSATFSLTHATAPRPSSQDPQAKPALLVSAFVSWSSSSRARGARWRRRLRRRGLRTISSDVSVPVFVWV